jgi:hypothetical protein
MDDLYEVDMEITERQTPAGRIKHDYTLLDEDHNESEPEPPEHWLKQLGATVFSTIALMIGGESLLVPWITAYLVVTT